MTPFPDSFHEWLSPQECDIIDQTLLPTRDRFSIRMTVYSLRYLLHLSQPVGLNIETLDPQHIRTLLEQDKTLPVPEEASVTDLLVRILSSSLKPLQAIAQQVNVPIEQLTLEQIIQWFKAQALANTAALDPAVSASTPLSLE
ncbi:MAG TPA: hypothetical protein V6D19_17230 [Stenomitos sp.]